MPVSKNRIAKNTVILYARMSIVMIVYLYTARIVLDQLGASDYGTYNVVGGVIVMLNFMTSALSQGIQRFLNFYKGRDDHDSINKVIWSGLVIMLAVGLALIVLTETAGLWFLNTKMNIPAHRIVAANWVYQTTIVSTLVSLIISPFNSLIIAHEDFGIYSYISVGHALLLLGIAFMLGASPIDKLIMYALMMLAVQVVQAVAIWSVCKVKYRHVHPVRHKDAGIYRSLLSFSGWNLLGVGMFVIGTQGVNIILNIYFGTIVNAARGIAVQISTRVDDFINNVQQAMNPQIVQLYSKGEYKEMMSLVDDNFRWNFALYWLIALPLIFEIDNILGLWLVDVPNYTAVFTVIIVLRSLLKCFERPVNSMNFAIGDMKPINLFATGSVLLTTAFMCVLFALGFPPYWAFIIDCISISFCITYYMYHARKHHLFSFVHFIKSIALPAAIVMICSAAGTYLLRKAIAPSGLTGLIYTICTTTILTSLLAYFVLFTRQNRQKLATTISEKLHIHRHNQQT